MHLLGWNVFELGERSPPHAFVGISPAILEAREADGKVIRYEYSDSLWSGHSRPTVGTSVLFAKL